MNKEVSDKMMEISREIARFNSEIFKMGREYRREIELILEKREKKDFFLFLIKILVLVAVPVAVTVILTFWVSSF